MTTAEKTGVAMRAMGRQGLMASMQCYGCMGLTAFYGAALEDEEGLKVCLSMEKRVYILERKCTQKSIDMERESGRVGEKERARARESENQKAR